MYKACSGIVDQFWHDCYWWGEGCDLEAKAIVDFGNSTDANNTSTNITDNSTSDANVTAGNITVNFFDWLKCYNETKGICGDLTGKYLYCFINKE